MTFGHQLRDEWLLDPALTYLNHGTVGATPRAVLTAQRALMDECERQPSRFMLRELTSTVVGQPRTDPPRLRVAADAVAAFVGAQGRDLVFVENTTTGVNAVLRSFPWEPGDELLIADHAYGAVAHAARYATRERGAQVKTIALTPPFTAASIADAFEAGVTPRTRLAIVDHISAESALVLPLAEIAARLKARGVLVLADGAHAPAGIALDVPSLGVDWYVANLHKWAFVPRSSGFLWTTPARQASVHPTVISWGLDTGYTDEFDLVGTRDASTHLSAPAALAFIERLGGLPAVLAWNHDLAWRGAQYLAGQWGVAFETPETLIGSMATVPLPASLGSTKADAARLRDALLFEDGIEVAVAAAYGRLQMRVAAQVYVDMADYERLAAALKARL